MARGVLPDLGQYRTAMIELDTSRLSRQGDLDRDFFRVDPNLMGYRRAVVESDSHRNGHPKAVRNIFLADGAME